MDRDCKRRAVLIVEDDMSHQRLLAEQLSRHGFSTIVVGRGEEALTLAENVRIDLVVLDVGLPGISGWETLRRLRDLPGGTTLPVVMLTGESSTENVVRGYEGGAQYVVPKPYSEDELVRGIEILT